MNSIDILAQAKDAILHQDVTLAEELYRSILSVQPHQIDALNGMGAIFFELGKPEQSLEYYRHAHAEAEKIFGGTYPARLSWIEKHKPALRALHGIGLNEYRLGNRARAEKIFQNILAMNPTDEQGIHFLLADIAKGKKLWKE